MKKLLLICALTIFAQVKTIIPLMTEEQKSLLDYIARSIPDDKESIMPDIEMAKEVCTHNPSPRIARACIHLGEILAVTGDFPTHYDTMYVEDKDCNGFATIEVPRWLNQD